MRLSKNLIIAIISLVVLTAIFACVVLVIYLNSYIITYDLNGGELSETETRVWVGSEYSLPTPTKQGYAFAGWYLDGKYFSPEGIWQIESDVVLTAKWGLSDEHGVVYNEVDGGYSIERYNGAVENIVILPEEYNGKPVVGLNSDALDLLKDRASEVEEGFIKVYVPATAISEEGASAFDGLVVCRYNTVGKDDFIYLEGESTNAVVGYMGTYNSVLIPEEYNGKQVNAIGAYAFYGSSAYVNAEADEFCRIFIPETVTSVGKGAFDLCGGSKASLYYLSSEGPLEIIDLSRLYSWLEKVAIDSDNEQLIDVITQIRPAFDWGEHSSANYYVRFDANGGEVLKNVTVNGETVTVKVKDTTFKKNKPYALPEPTREGYAFVGWYHDGTLVAQAGNSWVFNTHVELVAEWTEIQKEG